jgi:beta-lactam-binding protein with PASTA domain
MKTMKKLQSIFFMITFFMCFTIDINKYPHVSAAIAADQRIEIAKISLQKASKAETDVAKTEEMSLYYTEGVEEVYIRIPQVCKGDVLKIGDMLETFEGISTRIGFTSAQWLFLGKGTQTYPKCGETACTLARYNGSREKGQPFWYLKLEKGSAFAKNVLICDERACISTGKDTAGYYIDANEAKTTVMALQGTISVRARNVLQEISVRQGEGTEILSPDTPPTRTFTISPTTLRGIYNWIRTGLLVVRGSGNGHVTYQPTVPFSGTISDATAQSISVQNDQKKTINIPLKQGEFQTELSLHEGQNVFTLTASTFYGKVEETFSITRLPAPGAPLPFPDVRGQTPGAAQQTLAQLGFHQVTVSRRTTGRGVEETVVEQVPAPKTEVLPGTAVTLIVEQKQLVPVPKVRGLFPAEAREAIQNSQLRVGTVVQQATQRGPVGTIVEQSLKPNTPVSPNTVVDLVEEIAQLVQVPNVEGKSLSDARQLFTRLGLQVGNITGDANGTVVQQSPEPDARVPLQTKINLKVLDIEQKIKSILQGRYQSLPPFQPSSRFQQGGTQVRVDNRTDSTLHLYFHGPRAQFIQIPKNQVKEISLIPGMYQIVAEIKDSKVTPFYGQEFFIPNRPYDWIASIKRGRSWP